METGLTWIIQADLTYRSLSSSANCRPFSQIWSHLQFPRVKGWTFFRGHHSNHYIPLFFIHFIFQNFITILKNVPQSFHPYGHFPSCSLCQGLRVGDPLLGIASPGWMISGSGSSPSLLRSQGLLPVLWNPGHPGCLQQKYRFSTLAVTDRRYKNLRRKQVFLVEFWSHCHFIFQH